MSKETPYLQALRKHCGSKAFSVVLHLLSCNVCPRCCLRFTGVRDHAYADPAPDPVELAECLQGALTQSQLTDAQEAGKATAAVPSSNPAEQAVLAQAEQAQAVTLNTPTATTSCNAEGINHTFAPAALPASNTSTESAEQLPTASTAAHPLEETSANHASSNNAAAAAVPVCPACLGVLQSPEGALQGVPPAMLAGLPEAEGNAGSWQTSTSGTSHALAACVRQEGHIPTTIGLDITLPAACITRQLALWYHLRSKFASQGLYLSSHMYQEVVDLKEALRWMIAMPLAKQLGVQCEREGNLRVMLAYLHPASSSETDFLFINGGGGKGRGFKRKRGQPKIIYAGRSASETVLQQANRLSESYFLKQCAWSPPKQAAGVCLAYRVWRRPLYVAGRYLKLLRGVAQSPWIIDGQRKGVSSVEERIADTVLPHFKADKHKFMTAGREDFDVRMLGTGRPFVLEIINARAAAPPQSTFDSMQVVLRQADHGVQVQALQSVPRSICSLLKAGESEKQKSYTAVCQLPTPFTPDMMDTINSMKDLELHQQTPVRVSHRRADLVRHRTVYAMRCEAVPGSSRHLVLQLRTQAGTYIKEFVHSDEGRTQPHLASLLDLSKPASILQLDVNQIHMNFLESEGTSL